MHKKLPKTFFTSVLELMWKENSTLTVESKSCNSHGESDGTPSEIMIKILLLKKTMFWSKINFRATDCRHLNRKLHQGRIGWVWQQDLHFGRWRFVEIWFHICQVWLDLYSEPENQDRTERRKRSNSSPVELQFYLWHLHSPEELLCHELQPTQFTIHT